MLWLLDEVRVAIFISNSFGFDHLVRFATEDIPQRRNQESLSSVNPNHESTYSKRVKRYIIINLDFPLI